MKAVVDKERCKECGICMYYCPKKVILMTEELNSRGYRHIQVAEEGCIGCGICYTVCPDGVFSIEG